MRVVAGSARGIRLVAPPGTTTRPTSDRVREATFNALGSLGLVEDADVLDLFAGSGAMGIEALSRGAASATLVDHDAGAVDTVRANLNAARVAERAGVVRRDARQFLAATTEQFDLAFLDPPYGWKEWDELLIALPADTVVIESDRDIEVGDAWSVVRSRRYGSTVVAIVRRRAPREETTS